MLVLHASAPRVSTAIGADCEAAAADASRPRDAADIVTPARCGMTIVLGLLIGVVVGIISGIVGIGGGVMVVPILVYGFKYSQHTAQGTSLAMLLPPIGILAVMQYWRAGHIDVKMALLLA